MSAVQAPWVRIGARVRSNADLQACAARAASGFESAGVAPGDVVAVVLRNDFPMIEATVGAGMAGAYVVPVNWHNTAEEARHVLQDSGAKVLVVHADLLPPLAAVIPPGVLVLVAETAAELCLAYGVSDAQARVPDGQTGWQPWLDSQAPKPLPHAVSPGSMIYTSGTTGQPKGVRRAPPTAEQAAANFALMCSIGGLAGHAGRMQDVRLLIPGPAYHSSPNGWLFTLFRMGANLCIEPRFDPAQLLARIAAERITHVLAVPTMFVRLLALDAATRQAHDLSSIVHVMHVGAPCPPHVKRAMIGWWGPVISEHFGSTEVGAVTYCTAQEWLDHPGTVGRVLAGMTVQVLDEAGRPKPVGQPGEVACGRDNYPGFSYHGDDDKRRKAARGDLVATGDVGYFDADGYLYLVGRASDMIIFGGSNIYPAEIEQALMRVPGVADCAVFGIPDADYGEQVCAFVQAEPAAALDAAGISAALRPHLASYKIPRRIQIVATLPREDTGKIFKRKLRDPFWAATGRSI
ncbi:MAG: AMP-binding protein [Pseudomonadota bacterium]